jgi:hypothetical protein
VFGFVEGRNLKVDGGGYGLRDEQLPVPTGILLLADKVTNKNCI